MNKMTDLIIQKTLYHTVGINTIRMTKNRFLKDVKAYFYCDKKINKILNHPSFDGYGPSIKLTLTTRIGGLKALVSCIKLDLPNHKYKINGNNCKYLIDMLVNHTFNVAIQEPGNIIEIPFKSSTPVHIEINFSIKSNNSFLNF